jgi:hypothetical protein
MLLLVKLLSHTLKKCRPYIEGGRKDKREEITGEM